MMMMAGGSSTDTSPKIAGGLLSSAAALKYGSELGLGLIRFCCSANSLQVKGLYKGGLFASTNSGADVTATDGLGTTK
jgi:hypothetical protein